jgi:hypothetical protein
MHVYNSMMVLRSHMIREIFLDTSTNLHLEFKNPIYITCSTCIHPIAKFTTNLVAKHENNGSPRPIPIIESILDILRPQSVPMVAQQSSSPRTYVAILLLQ